MPFKNKLVLIALGIFVFIAGVAFYFLVVRKPEVKEEETPSFREIGSASPSQGSGTFYTGSQAIVLTDLTGTNLSGTAYRSIITGQIFWAAYITAPDIPQEQFYQMWVVSNELQYQPAGILYKDANGYYSRSYGYTFDPGKPFFETVDQLPNTLVITVEVVDDTTMEKKLMEGVFTR